MDVIFYIIQFLFFKIIYLHTPILAGWNIDQMTVFICSFIFVDAFNMTFFANNAWWFPQTINKGDLDYYLTRPVSPFFFLGFKEFAANSLINLIMATAIFTYAIISYPGELNSIKLFIFVLLLINGAFLYYMTNLLFLLSVFWTGSNRGYGDLFFAAEKVFQRPDLIFNTYIRRFFVSILPFAVMASVPTRFLFEENTGHLIIEMLLASVFVYFVVSIVWKKGIRDYSSASS
jgi:ABC-2 type transport system permease protein